MWNSLRWDEKKKIKKQIKILPIFKPAKAGVVLAGNEGGEGTGLSNDMIGKFIASSTADEITDATVSVGEDSGGDTSIELTSLEAVEQKRTKLTSVFRNSTFTRWN